MSSERRQYKGVKKSKLGQSIILGAKKAFASERKKETASEHTK